MPQLAQDQNIPQGSRPDLDSFLDSFIGGQRGQALGAMERQETRASAGQRGQRGAGSPSPPPEPTTPTTTTPTTPALADQGSQTPGSVPLDVYSSGAETAPGETAPGVESYLDQLLKMTPADVAQKTGQQVPADWGDYMRNLPGEAASFAWRHRPSTEEMMIGAGGLAGGLLTGGGVLAAGTLGAGGEALYQMLQHLRDWNSGIVPGGAQTFEKAGITGASTTSGQEALTREAGSYATAAGQELLPRLAGRGLQSRAASQAEKLIGGGIDRATAEAIAREGMPLAASRSGLIQRFQGSLTEARNILNQAYARRAAIDLTQAGTPTLRTVTPGLQAAQNALRTSRGVVLPGNRAAFDALQQEINFYRRSPWLNLNDLRQLAESGQGRASGVARDLIHQLDPAIASAETRQGMWERGLAAVQQTPPGPTWQQKVIDAVLKGGPAATAAAAAHYGGAGGGKTVLAGAAGLALPALKTLTGSTAFRTASIKAQQLAVQALNSGAPMSEVLNYLGSRAARFGTGVALGRVPTAVSIGNEALGRPLNLPPPNPLPPGQPPQK